MAHGKEEMPLPPKPIPPADSDCCDSGCDMCVKDVYEQELKIWEQECNNILLAKVRHCFHLAIFGSVTGWMRWKRFGIYKNSKIDQSLFCTGNELNRYFVSKNIPQNRTQDIGRLRYYD